jgi:hypothetical protein
MLMKRIAIGTLLILCALALVTPASAVTVNGVEYVILAKSKVLMENSADCEPLPANTLGCMIINGNVAVSDPNGILHIGSNNIINGTATANHIFFGTNSHITECRFNTSSGVDPLTVCDSVVTPLPANTLPIVAAWPPGPLGAVPVDTCVNAAANVTVAAGATQPLAPGCYKDIRINAGGTLNLSAGNYVVKNFRMIAGATLNGQGSAATSVNSQSQFITEANVNINGVTIKSPGSVGFSVTEFIKIFNNSNLSDVVLYAPTSGIHLHTGMNANGLEAVANFITVEPIIVVGQPPAPFCPCFAEFIKTGNNVFLFGGHNLNNPLNLFFISPTCDPAAGEQVNATASTDATATLDVTGKTTTGKHVIVQGPSGTFCSSALLP